MKSKDTSVLGDVCESLAANSLVAGSAAPNNQFNSLFELLTSALKEPSFENLLWHVARKIVDTLCLEDCLIYFYDADTGKLRQKAACGPKGNPDSGIHNALEVSLGSGLVGACAELKEPILVNDTRKDSRYIIDDVVRLSELCVPIVSNGTLVGVIDSESSCCGFYTEEHVQFLTAVAAVIATKYQSYQSIDSLKQTVCQLEKAEQLQQALFNIAELVYNTGSLYEFYQRMHQYVVDLIDGEVFFVALMNEQGTAIDIPYPSDNGAKYPFPACIEQRHFSGSLAAKVIQTNSPIRLNAEELAGLVGVPEPIACHWASYAWLGVPFVEVSGIRGCVGVQRVNPESTSFKQQDQDLLVYISQHISNAIKRKQDEAALQQLALSDALTGLPNRTLFLDRLEHSLKRDRSVDSFQTHVFFIDLDRFKHINDAYGHHVGDEVLKEVGRRVKLCLRDSDTLGRISGDEFAIVLEDIEQTDILETISRRIVSAFETPVSTSAGDVKLSASIGVCSASEELCDGEELLKMADHAMYQAKAAGQGEVVISSQSESQVSHARRVESELASALANEEFELHFQPIYSLSGSRLVGFEVLTRWQHPELGLLYPDKFIEIAEKSGQIIALDSYVLMKSAELLQNWRNSGNGSYLSVNVSGRTLTSAGFVELVRKCYQDYRLNPGSLNIEVTEQCLIGDLQGATERLTEISSLGAKVFLDDFGTGYSSLNYLHRLPIDVLKVDRSFVQSFHESEAAESIVRTIVMLAKSLDIEVVAEGIEEDKHVEALVGLSVDYGQGYLLGRPMPLGKIADFQ